MLTGGAAAAGAVGCGFGWLLAAVDAVLDVADETVVAGGADWIGTPVLRAATKAANDPLVPWTGDRESPICDVEPSSSERKASLPASVPVAAAADDGGAPVVTFRAA